MKTVLNMIPEGVIICTKSYLGKNSEMVLCNQEAIKLLKHKEEPKEGEEVNKSEIEALNTTHMLPANILVQKRLLPFFHLDADEKYNPE